MSTWHQLKNPVLLHHYSKWTVVTDPPGRLLTVMRLVSYEAAEKYIANLDKHGNAKHSYILPPGGKWNADN